MEGDAGAGLAGYVIGTLPQRLEEVDDVFGGSFDLLESESGCELDRKSTRLNSSHWE